MQHFTLAAKCFRAAYGGAVGAEESLPADARGRLAILHTWLQQACEYEAAIGAQPEQNLGDSEDRDVVETYRSFLFFYFATIGVLSAPAGGRAPLKTTTSVQAALERHLAALSQRNAALVITGLQELEPLTRRISSLMREKLITLGLIACLSILADGDAWIASMVALLLEQLQAGYQALEPWQPSSIEAVALKSFFQSFWLDTLCSWVWCIGQLPIPPFSRPVGPRLVDAVQEHAPASAFHHPGESSAMERLSCSFQSTGAQFRDQHWYRCATCSFKDDEGICSACALVCHAGHEVVYARFSGFFCDCGTSSSGSVSNARKDTAACCLRRDVAAFKQQSPSTACPMLMPSQDAYERQDAIEDITIGYWERAMSTEDELWEPPSNLEALQTCLQLAMKRLWQGWASALTRNSASPAEFRLKHPFRITVDSKIRLSKALSWLRQEALRMSIAAAMERTRTPAIPTEHLQMVTPYAGSTLTSEGPAHPSVAATAFTNHPMSSRMTRESTRSNPSNSVLVERLMWVPTATQVITRVRHLDQVQNLPWMTIDLCLEPSIVADADSDEECLQTRLDPFLVFTDGLMLVFIPAWDAAGPCTPHDRQWNANADDAAEGSAFLADGHRWTASSPEPAASSRLSSPCWLTAAMDTRRWQRSAIGISAGTIRFARTQRQPGGQERLLALSHETSTLRLFSRNSPWPLCHPSCPPSGQVQGQYWMQPRASLTSSSDVARDASGTSRTGRSALAAEANATSSGEHGVAAGSASLAPTRSASAPSANQTGTRVACGPAAASLNRWQNLSQSGHMPCRPLQLASMVSVSETMQIPDSTVNGMQRLNSAMTPGDSDAQASSGAPQSMTSSGGDGSAPRPYALPSYASSSPSGSMSTSHPATAATTTQRSGISRSRPYLWPPPPLASAQPGDAAQRAVLPSNRAAWSSHLLLERKTLDNGQKIADAVWLDGYADDWLLLLGHSRRSLEVCTLAYCCSCWVCRLIRQAHGAPETVENADAAILNEAVDAPSAWGRRPVEQKFSQGAPMPATATEHREWISLDAMNAAIETTTAATALHEDAISAAETEREPHRMQRAPKSSALSESSRKSFRRDIELLSDPIWVPSATKDHDPWRMRWVKRFALDWETCGSSESMSVGRSPAEQEVYPKTPDCSQDGAIHLGKASVQAWTHGSVILDARDLMHSPPGRLLLFLVLTNNLLLVYEYVATVRMTSIREPQMPQPALLASVWLPTPSCSSIEDKHEQAPEASVANGDPREPSAGPVGVVGLCFDHSRQQLDLFWSNGYWSRWKLEWGMREASNPDELTEERWLDEASMHHSEQMTFAPGVLRPLLLKPVSLTQLLHWEASSKRTLEAIRRIPILPSDGDSCTNNRLMLLMNGQDLSLLWLPPNDEQPASMHGLEAPVLQKDATLQTASSDRTDALKSSVILWTQTTTSFDLLTDSTHRAAEHHLLERYRRRRLLDAVGVAFSQSCTCCTLFPLRLHLALVYEDGSVLGVCTSLSIPPSEARHGACSSPRQRTKQASAIAIDRNNSTAKSDAARCSPVSQHGHRFVYSYHQQATLIEPSVAPWLPDLSNATRLGIATWWPVEPKTTSLIRENEPNGQTPLLLAEHRTSRGCLVGFFEALERIPNESLAFGGDFWRLGLPSVASAVQWANSWPEETTGRIQALPSLRYTSADGRQGVRPGPKCTALAWQVAGLGACPQLVLQWSAMDKASWALLGIRMAWLHIRYPRIPSGAEPVESRTLELYGAGDDLLTSSTHPKHRSRLRLTPLSDPHAVLPPDVQYEWQWMECCWDDPALLQSNPWSRQVTLTVPEATSWSSPVWLVLGKVLVYGLRLPSPALDRWIALLSWRQECQLERQQIERLVDAASSHCLRPASPSIVSLGNTSVGALLERAFIVLGLALLHTFGCTEALGRITEAERPWHELLLESLFRGQWQRLRYAPIGKADLPRQWAGSWVPPMWLDGMESALGKDDASHRAARLPSVWGHRPLSDLMLLLLDARGHGLQPVGYLGLGWPRVLHYLDSISSKMSSPWVPPLAQRGSMESELWLTTLKRLATTERQQAWCYAESMRSLAVSAERDGIIASGMEETPSIGCLYGALAGSALRWATDGLAWLTETLRRIVEVSTGTLLSMTQWRSWARVYVETAALFWPIQNVNGDHESSLGRRFTAAATKFLSLLDSRDSHPAQWQASLGLGKLHWFFVSFALHPQETVASSFGQHWLDIANEEAKTSSWPHLMHHWWYGWLMAMLLGYVCELSGTADPLPDPITFIEADAAGYLRARLCLLLRKTLEHGQADAHWQCFFEQMCVLAGGSGSELATRIMTLLGGEIPKQPWSMITGAALGRNDDQQDRAQTVLEALWLVTVPSKETPYGVDSMQQVYSSTWSASAMSSPWPPSCEPTPSTQVPAWPQIALKVWIQQFAHQWQSDTSICYQQWLAAYASLGLASFCLHCIQQTNDEIVRASVAAPRNSSRDPQWLVALVQSIEVALWDWLGLGFQFGFLTRAPMAVQRLLGVLIPTPSAVDEALRIAAIRQVGHALAFPWHQTPLACTKTGQMAHRRASTTCWLRWQRQQRVQQAIAWVLATPDGSLSRYLGTPSSASFLLHSLLETLLVALEQDDDPSARGVLQLLQTLNSFPPSMRRRINRVGWRLLQTLLMHPTARSIHQEAVIALLARMLAHDWGESPPEEQVPQGHDASSEHALRSLLKRYIVLYRPKSGGAFAPSVDDTLGVLLAQLESIADQDVLKGHCLSPADEALDRAMRHSPPKNALSEPVATTNPEASEDRGADPSWRGASLVCPDCRHEALQRLAVQQGSTAAVMLTESIQRQPLQALAERIRYEHDVVKAFWQTPRRLHRLSIRLSQCRTTATIYAVRVLLQRALSNTSVATAAASTVAMSTEAATCSQPHACYDGHEDREWTCAFEIIYRQAGSILTILAPLTELPERQPPDWTAITGLVLEFSRCSGRTSLPETISCPRCARLVTERGGICPGCKENVYQCRACRFIDYGRLDALLCRECGHSRYLRYEVELETSAVRALPEIQSLAAQRRGGCFGINPHPTSLLSETEPPPLVPQSSEVPASPDMPASRTVRAAPGCSVSAGITLTDWLVGLGAVERASALQQWWFHAHAMLMLPLACGRCAVRRFPFLWQQFLEAVRGAAPASVALWRQRFAPLLPLLSTPVLWQRLQQPGQGIPSQLVHEQARIMQSWPGNASLAWVQLLEEAVLQFGICQRPTDPTLEWRQVTWQALQRNLVVWAPLVSFPETTESQDRVKEFVPVERLATPRFGDRATYLAALYGQRWRNRCSVRRIQRGEWFKAGLHPRQLVHSGTLWVALFHPYAPEIRHWALRVLARLPTCWLGLFSAQTLLCSCVQVQRHGYLEVTEAYWMLWRSFWQQQETWVAFWDAFGGLELLCVIVAGIARGLSLPVDMDGQSAGQVFRWAPYLRQSLLEEWLWFIREAMQRRKRLHWTCTAYRSLLEAFEALYVDGAVTLAAQIASIIRTVTEAEPRLARWQAQWMVDRLRTLAISRCQRSIEFAADDADSMDSEKQNEASGRDMVSLDSTGYF